MKQSKSALCVLLAGTLWGSMGLFVRKLNAVGLYALDIVQLRIAISLVLVGLYLLIFARDKLRVRLRDLWCFAGTGIVSLLLFSWCYFSGMQEASLSVMAVLLYTSPAFIVLLSVLLFRETLTRQKLLALVLTFAGCCLVSGLGSGSAVSMKGLLLGLGSGFFYALYSIFAPFGLRHYSPLAVVFWTFVFAALGALFVADWGNLMTVLSVPQNALLAAGLVLLSTVAPYILYTKGLANVESGKASIMASIEPVVGTLVGTLVFGEPISAGVFLGLACILACVYILR